MFTSIVFSKDRPLQLDLCLQSIKKNFFADSRILVLYTTSKGYDKSYEQLITEHPSVMFLKQSHNIFDVGHCRNLLCAELGHEKLVAAFRSACISLSHFS